MSELISPMTIEIEQIDKTTTPYNDGVSGRKFPVNNTVRSTPFQIPAQVVFGDRDQKGNFTQLGTDEQTKGYVVLDYTDLKNLGKVLKRGDRITKLISKQGEMNVELYFTTAQGDPAAHFDGEFNLVRMLFEDRKPVG